MKVVNLTRGRDRSVEGCVQYVAGQAREGGIRFLMCVVITPDGASFVSTGGEALLTEAIGALHRSMTTMEQHAEDAE